MIGRTKSFIKTSHKFNYKTYFIEYYRLNFKKTADGLSRASIKTLFLVFTESPAPLKTSKLEKITNLLCDNVTKKTIVT